MMKQANAHEVPQDRLSKIEAFCQQIKDIRSHREQIYLTTRARDYYWYSPILTRQLSEKQADVVVVPKNVDELRQIVSAAVKLGLPMTLRGGGTGNYGQCVPLEGGIVIVMTELNRVIEFGDGWVKAEGGARISTLDREARLHGQELLMYSSTKRIATIGGFLAGGSGGAGSLRNGLLRDNGNVRYAKVMTIEAEPQEIELHGVETEKVMHAYGTNGIVVEVEIVLEPAVEWVHCAVLFDSYLDCLRFCYEAEARNLDGFLLTAVERRFSKFYKRYGDLFPGNKDAVFAMAHPDHFDDFKKLAAEMHALVSFSGTEEEILARGLQPAYECGWNHTTLQALKVDRSWTYLQIRYPSDDPISIVEQQMQEFGEDVYMHHEFARSAGELSLLSLPLVRYLGDDAIYDLIDRYEAVGCSVYNPHSYVLEDGGRKVVDQNQINFKSQADPHGLLNPGKTMGWTDDMAKVLPT